MLLYLAIYKNALQRYSSTIVVPFVAPFGEFPSSHFYNYTKGINYAKR